MGAVKHSDGAGNGNANALLEVRGLKTHFFTADGRVVRAVDGVSFSVGKGRCVGIVGESGSGKSVTARSILRLVERPGKIIDGEMLFEGEDMLSWSESRMRDVRGKEIGVVFQDPTASMDPYMTAGVHFIETIRQHLPLSHSEARQRALDALRTTGVPQPEDVLKRHAVDFSPGMIQRIMIALAIVCEPRLVIADEPTTTLGVLVQDQILRELKRVQQELGTALVLITHDFGVVAQLADWIVVMYAGKIVEQGPAEILLRDPRHPYTAGLITSVPQLDQHRAQRLPTISGAPPDVAALPPGCPFAPRCSNVRPDHCPEQMPPSDVVREGERVAACFYPVVKS